MMIQRIALTVAVLAGAIGIVLPAQAQSNQARDLEISVQDQQNTNNPYSEGQLNGLANQINETADPDIDSGAPGVYPLPRVQDLPVNPVIIESGLDTSAPEDRFDDYAIGVSF